MELLVFKNILGLIVIQISLLTSSWEILLNRISKGYSRMLSVDTFLSRANFSVKEVWECILLSFRLPSRENLTIEMTLSTESLLSIEVSTMPINCLLLGRQCRQKNLLLDEQCRQNVWYQVNNANQMFAMKNNVNRKFTIKKTKSKKKYGEEYVDKIWYWVESVDINLSMERGQCWQKKTFERITSTENWLRSG